MARTDNLSNYLTDVAEAIKTKKGDDTPIKASEFDTEITNLPSGGGENIQDYISSTSDNTSNTQVYIYNQILNRIKKLPTLDLSNIKNSIVLQNLFNGYPALTEVPDVIINDSINEFSLQGTFNGCKKITNIDNILNKLKGKKITNLQNTFNNTNIQDFSFLKELDISSITTMNNTFSTTPAQDFAVFSELDTSNLTSISSIFSYCSNLKELPLFDTSNITNMNSAFYGCSLVTEIPAYNTSKCKNFSSIFHDMYSLIKVPKLDFSSADDIDDMFYGSYPTFSLDTVTDLGGFENLGKAYTRAQDNYTYYVLNLVQCHNLTKESVLNVFNNLYDLHQTYADELHTQQIQLSNKSKQLLTEEDIAIATEKGWNVV